MFIRRRERQVRDGADSEFKSLTRWRVVKPS
jgi:hypothetical protein